MRPAGSLAAQAAPLIEAACAAPAEEEPRRRLAAWLDERGHALGRFMRLQLDRHAHEARTLRGHPAVGLEERRGTDAALRAWIELAPALGTIHGRGGGASIRLVRGMAGAVTVRWEELADPGWLAAAPIEHLDVIGPIHEGGLERLLDLPARRSLRSLAIVGAGLDDRAAAAIAAASWPRLRWLSLAENRVGRGGAEALVASPTLPRLILANLDGNPGDPCERGLDAHDTGDTGFDWFASPFNRPASPTERTDEIVEKVFSSWSEAMWRSHGEPAWLRVLWRSKGERPHRDNLWDGLTDAVAHDGDFDGATLLGGSLTRLRAERSRWRRANLSASTIEDVDLGGADLADAALSYATLTRARFAGAVAPRLRLDRARITGCDFTGADLSAARFEDAVVTDSCFRDARLSCHDGICDLSRTRRARFVRCDLRGADVDNREMVDVEMVDCATEGMRGAPRRLARS